MFPSVSHHSDLVSKLLHFDFFTEIHRFPTSQKYFFFSLENRNYSSAKGLIIEGISEGPETSGLYQVLVFPWVVCGHRPTSRHCVYSNHQPGLSPGGVNVSGWMRRQSAGQKGVRNLDPWVCLGSFLPSEETSCTQCQTITIISQ